MAKPKELPHFNGAEEEATFWETHSVADYWNQMEPVEVKAERQRKKLISIRLDPVYLEQIKQVANRKGIPYQSLIQMWLVEKLAEQTPSAPAGD